MSFINSLKSHPTVLNIAKHPFKSYFKAASCGFGFTFGTNLAVGVVNPDPPMSIYEHPQAFMFTDLECEGSDYTVATYYHIIDANGASASNANNTNNTMTSYEISTEEDHKVEWLPPLHELTTSKTWPEYNTVVFKKIKDVLQQHV